MSSSYDELKTIHATLPSFKPLFPSSALSIMAFLYLLAFFALAFFFTTLPTKTHPLREFSVAVGASLFAGFGVVALFCTLGVYV